MHLCLGHQNTALRSLSNSKECIGCHIKVEVNANRIQITQISGEWTIRYCPTYLMRSSTFHQFQLQLKSPSICYHQAAITVSTWTTFGNCTYSASKPLIWNSLLPSWVMVIVWRLRGNIIRTALCWIMWHNVHSLQHTYMSSSYRSNRLDLSLWDPYVVCRGGCLELYYCNMVEWFWWDSSLISTTNWFLSVLWHCWFGL